MRGGGRETTAVGEGGDRGSENLFFVLPSLLEETRFSSVSFRAQDERIYLRVCCNSEQCKPREEKACNRSTREPVDRRRAAAAAESTTIASFFLFLSSLSLAPPHLVQLLLNLDDAHAARHANDLALVVALVLDRGLDAARVGARGGRRREDDGVVGVVVDVAPPLRRRRSRARDGGGHAVCRRGGGLSGLLAPPCREKKKSAEWGERERDFLLSFSLNSVDEKSERALCFKGKKNRRGALSRRRHKRICASLFSSEDRKKQNCRAAMAHAPL